jgi:hypothetical protein
LTTKISDNENQNISHKEVSWLLGVTFAGLGTGFILLILTLSMIYAVILCSLGILIVLPLARNEKGNDFAMQAVAIYFVSGVIGVVVGWGSTFGTGLPLTSILSQISLIIFLI